jgi:hypothetical protein
VELTRGAYVAQTGDPPSREQNKLRPTQAQTVIAAAILQHLHAVITTGRAWDPATATHGSRARPEPAADPTLDANDSR